MPEIALPTKSRYSRVAVFCGSSSGKKDSYAAAAVELAQELIARGVDLVYGGGGIGLMGLVSQTVQKGGRHVLGIMPRSLLDDERTGDTVGDVIPVSDMHERKKEIARFSDCFIALPGGYGTLEEFLEMISWTQLGIHNKPVGLLNVDGFYDSFLSFIDKAVDDGFIIPSQRNIIVSAPTAKELFRKLEEYVPVKSLLDKSQWEGVQPEKAACNGVNGVNGVGAFQANGVSLVES